MTRSNTEPAGAVPSGRRGRIGLALTAVQVCALLGSAVLAAAPATAQAEYYSGPIFGYYQLCLDDRNALTKDFNPVQVYTCNGTKAQQWTVVQADNTIQALGKCLDVRRGGTTEGTTVDLYDCNGTAAQVWIPKNDNAFYNPQSDKCLDDTHWSTTPGTQAQIWDCTGKANQFWPLEASASYEVWAGPPGDAASGSRMPLSPTGMYMRSAIVP